MKDQRHNDEELYQEIIAELDKGAAEYDHLMACGYAPAKRRKTAIMKWYAAAASFTGLLIISTTLFVKHQDNVSRHTASTESVIKDFSARKTLVPPTENTDSDLYRLTAKLERQPEKKQQDVPYHLFTAMLPEVEFCPDSNDEHDNGIHLPQVSKERSFDLVCRVTLPEVTAYADSTTFMFSSELMVACDEICYNDSKY